MVTRHGLEDGDSVYFREVQGMEGINSNAESPLLYKVKVISPYKFSIGDTTSFGAYVTGGVAAQVLDEPCLPTFNPRDYLFLPGCWDAQLALGGML